MSGFTCYSCGGPTRAEGHPCGDCVQSGITQLESDLGSSQPDPPSNVAGQGNESTTWQPPATTQAPNRYWWQRD